MDKEIEGREGGEREGGGGEREREREVGGCPKFRPP